MAQVRMIMDKEMITSYRFKAFTPFLPILAASCFPNRELEGVEDLRKFYGQDDTY